MLCASTSPRSPSSLPLVNQKKNRRVKDSSSSPLSSSSSSSPKNDRRSKKRPLENRHCIAPIASPFHDNINNNNNASTLSPKFPLPRSRRTKCCFFRWCCCLRRTCEVLIRGFFHAMSQWKVLLLGQFLSLLLAGTGATSATLHLNCSLSAPTFQSLFLYVGLSLHCLAFLKTTTKTTKTKEGTVDVGDSEVAWWWSWVGNYMKGKDCVDKSESSMDSSVSSKDDKEIPLSHHHSQTTEEANNADRKDTLSPSVKTLDDLEEADRESNGESEEEDTNTPPYSLCGLIPLHGPAISYLFLSLVDVEANYLTFLAFRYTTFTSISVFDSLSIPSAMICSRLFLSRRYRWAHLLGAAICMAGTLLNVLSDYESPDPSRFPRKVLGDLLSIGGGLLYGVSAVLAEHAVQNYGGQEEYLAVLGFFGAIISILQVLLLERADVGYFFLHRPDWERDHVDDDLITGGGSSNGAGGDSTHSPACSKIAGVGLLLLYAFANYISYVGVARFLSVSESAMLKLSLLTGDLWAVLFSVVAEHIIPHLLFWPALFFILSGVFVYEIAPSPIKPEEELTEEERQRGIVSLDQEDYVSWMDDYASWANEEEREQTIYNDLELTVEHKKKMTVTLERGR